MRLLQTRSCTTLHVHNLQVAASAMQPDSIRALALQLLLASPVMSPRQARELSEPSISSPEYTAAMAVVTAHAPPLASLPESSDSLPGTSCNSQNPLCATFCPGQSRQARHQCCPKPQGSSAHSWMYVHRKAGPCGRILLSRCWPLLLLPLLCLTDSRSHQLCSDWFHHPQR